jgi:hypothetical protein
MYCTYIHTYQPIPRLPAPHHRHRGIEVLLFAVRCKSVPDPLLCTFQPHEPPPHVIRSPVRDFVSEAHQSYLKGRGSSGRGNKVCALSTSLFGVRCGPQQGRKDRLWREVRSQSLDRICLSSDHTMARGLVSLVPGCHLSHFSLPSRASRILPCDSPFSSVPMRELAMKIAAIAILQSPSPKRFCDWAEAKAGRRHPEEASHGEYHRGADGSPCVDIFPAER